MSCGGSTTKKMKAGGTSSNKPCGPGLCRDGQGSCVNCASAKLAGVITTGISSLFANAIGGKLRKNNAAKKKISTAKTEAAQETAQEKRKGGAVKKYAMGGSTEKALLPMMGMPMYSNNPRSEQGRILKKGGSTTNRAVSPGCSGGMVKDASGKCVMERKFKAGGTLKPVPTNKVGLAKLPTVVRNKMGFQKKGGPVKKK
jgi:hypothetical protein